MPLSTTLSGLPREVLVEEHLAVGVVADMRLAVVEDDSALDLAPRGDPGDDVEGIGRVAGRADDVEGREDEADDLAAAETAIALVVAVLWPQGEAVRAGVDGGEDLGVSRSGSDGCCARPLVDAKATRLTASQKAKRRRTRIFWAVPPRVSRLCACRRLSFMQQRRCHSSVTTVPAGSGA